VLLLAGLILFVCYRSQLRDAWEQADRMRPS
jgi:hypothetical protein